MRRPANLLIYYGWLNAYESAECSWDNEKVAQSLAKYDLLVFGDGIADPSHGDYANSKVIISRIKQLNPFALIFGYVSVDQKLSSFETKTLLWDNIGAHGIFMDEAGYDYGKNRVEFNARVDFVHSRENANVCFANAWNIDNVIGVDEDPVHPNATYNPGLIASNLGTADWYLLESFSVNTESYLTGYADIGDVISRGEKAVLYDIQLAAVGIIENSDSDAQVRADFSYCVGLAYSLNAIGVSDTNYGANSAKSKFFKRPEHRDIIITEDVPAVSTVGDNVLLSYIDQSKIKIDFTQNKESSSIEQY